MKIKVEKNGITKEVDNESLLADYLLAGWKKVQEKTQENKFRSNPFDKKANK